jgi:endonuclease YncB( thermonuclease family)
MTKTIVALAVALTGLSVSVTEMTPVLAYDQLHGRAVVVDGDTVEVEGIPVRLKGIDAAERGTPRGDAATAAMRAIVTRTLICNLTSERTHGRRVGWCRTPDGTDIAQALIRKGKALACPRYDTRYVGDELAEARAVQPRAPYCIERGRS